MAKQQQHEALMHALRKYGYDAHIQPLLLGHGGCVYQTSQQALQCIGINRKHAEVVMKKMHRHAIKCLHNILIERRKLQQERKTRQGVG